MPVIGITGGIATGKSTFSGLLHQRLSAEFFDADRAVHELLSSDAAVQAEILAQFGADTFSPDGAPDRQRLRELVFADENARERLEEILHPRIKAQWKALAQRAAASDQWLLVDLPLLFEVGAEGEFDRVVVVACSERNQRQRLEAARGLTPDMARRIISAQLKLAIKIKKAHHLIWNDSIVERLTEHADLLTTWLRARYG